MAVSQTPTLEPQIPPRRQPVSFLNRRAGTFYRRYGKRWLDVCVAALGLAVLWPLFLLIAALIKITSRGPVFYTQNRVGCDARIFRIAKFRSMVVDAETRGPGITTGDDKRVTKLGRILRELKLDELPQLWNVLKGDMSLVGPRPELPSYVAVYALAQLGVLSIRPGITDLASIRYRHEEKMLERATDPDAFYRGIVLPHKLALNLKYIEQMSFALDVKLILLTLRSIFS